MAAEKQQDSEHRYDFLLFDLDDTLYPLSSGLSTEVTKRIRDYMIEKLRIEASQVPELCSSLYKYYGTTMAGLRAIGYKFDYDDFHGFVHGTLPYDLLKPDPLLRSLLLSIPIRKAIFTNADKGHATRALARLGLEDCFEGIISFETLNKSSKANESVEEDESPMFDINEYTAALNSGIELPKSPVVCKPFEEAYEQAFKIACIDPHRTNYHPPFCQVFFDDSLRNLQTAKRLGIHTVWVGASHRTKGVDHALESIHNIKEALPEFWEATETSEGAKYLEEIEVRA